jgi:hypothetical protein
LLRATLADRDAWEYVTFEGESDVPQAFTHWQAQTV